MPAHSAATIERQVRGYMDACTSGDAAAIEACLSANAVHYFPPDMYDGPWRGGALIARRWAQLVMEKQSAWTVDCLIVDEPRQRAACEWTHFKQAAGVILRGTEFYEFADDGRISEIRAYYASPQDSRLARLELGGFAYEARGYPEQP